MKRCLVTTVSTIAILFGGVTMAAAQDKSVPAAQDPSFSTPGAGENPKEVAPPDNSPIQPGWTMTEDRPGSASRMDRSSYRSYRENWETLTGILISGTYSANQLLGAKVSDASGDAVGEIGDLMVDSKNQVTKVIVEVGGFLGIGSKDVAIDLSELKRGAYLDFISAKTKDELTSLPEYRNENGNWVRNKTQSDPKEK